MNKRILYGLGAIALVIATFAAASWWASPLLAQSESEVATASGQAINQDAPAAADHGPGHGPGHGWPGDRDDDLVSFYGFVAARPTESLTGTWTISSTNLVTVTATDRTWFRSDFGELAVGACVKVETRAETPTLARSIETRPAFKCNLPDVEDPVIKVYGFVESMPADVLTGTWTISATSIMTFTANDDTEFNQEHGDFAPGVCVKIKAFTSAPSVATSIMTVPAYKCTGAHDDDHGHPWFDGMLFGAIVSLPDNPDLLGVWGVGSATFTVTAETRLDAKVTPFEVGVFVKVRFTEENGQMVAVDVKSIFKGEHHGHDDNGNGCHDGFEGQASGPIVTVPDELIGMWDIAGVPYVVNEQTILDENAAYDPGVVVKVKYFIDANHERVAIKIAIKTDNPVNNHPDIFAFMGIVDDKPDGFIGPWTISGQTFVTTDTTIFKEEHGLLIKTAYVKVTYRIEDNGRKVLMLETEVPPGGGDQDDAGVIEKIDDGGIAAASVTASGVWRIGGKDFVVTEATSLNDLAAALAVGNTALVNSYTDANGSQVATRIQAFDVVSRVMVPFSQR